MEPHELRHFELRELGYFVAVAEELHFARAAERVGIHQSPLSKAITTMERHLGVRLFVRDRRSTQLTAIGRILLSDARRILAEVNQTRLDILAAAAGRMGRLRIAVTDEFAQPRVAALLRQTYKEDSGVHVHVVQESLPEQLRQLRAGLLDVGLASAVSDLPPSSAHEWGCAPVVGLGPLGEDIDANPLWKDTPAAVLERGHALSAAAEIEWETLATLPLLIVGSGAMTCGGCSTLVQHHVRSHIRYVESVGLLVTLAAAGKGIGLLAQTMAKTIQRDDLIVRPLHTRRPKITTYLLRLSDGEAPVVTRFLERALKRA